MQREIAAARYTWAAGQPRAAAVPTCPTAMAEADSCLRSPRFAWLVLRRNDRLGGRRVGGTTGSRTLPGRCQSYAREKGFYEMGVLRGGCATLSRKRNDSKINRAVRVRLLV